MKATDLDLYRWSIRSSFWIGPTGTSLVSLVQSYFPSGRDSCGSYLEVNSEGTIPDAAVSAGSATVPFDFHIDFQLWCSQAR